MLPRETISWHFDGTDYTTKLTKPIRTKDELEVDGDLNHDGTNVGFYGATPVAQQTGVAVNAAAIHAALVNLGLITA